MLKNIITINGQTFYSLKAFECEGNVSLDKEYLENLSGGKFAVSEVLVLSENENNINDIIIIDNNEFDFEEYHTMLENGLDDESTDYFVEYAKCVSKNSYDLKTFKTENEMMEYIKEDVL